MEGTGETHLQPVRIVRHEFLPSASLVESAQRFIDPGHVTRHPIRVFGSAQVGVDLWDYNHNVFDGRLFDISETFRQSKPEIINLAAQAIKWREFPNRQVRFAFRAADQSAFDERVAGLGSIGELLTLPPPAQGNFLYFDLPLRVIRQEEMRATRAMEWAKEAGRFVVRPLQLGGYDLPARRAGPRQSQEPDLSEAS